MNSNWLDIDVLEDYLDGKLDAKAMHFVEKQAFEDPFVAEALMGLSQSVKRKQTLSLLQKQLQERVAQQPIKRKLWGITTMRLSIAATAAVMFVVASLMFWMKESNRQKQLATNKSKDVEVNLDTTAQVAVITQQKQGDDIINDAIQSLKKNGYAKNKTIVAPKYKANQPNIIADDKPLAAAINTHGISVSSISVAESQKNDSKIVIRGLNNLPLVKGKVISQSDGQGLPGVSVNVEGTNIATRTDNQGNFALRLDSSVLAKKLIANYIGYNSASIKASADTPISIAMIENKSALNEVLVVGYGKKEEKRVVSASVGTIKGLEGTVSGLPISPSPVDGWQKYNQYLAEKNQLLKTEKVNKTVELSFSILNDGTVTDIKIVNSLGKVYDEEAIRLVKKGPKWKYDAKKNNQAKLRIGF